MCDETTEAENDAYLAGRMTRRQFSKMSAGVAAGLMLPRVAGAADVVESAVMVTTPDGEADGYLIHPKTGKHPGVVLWPDIFGIRPAFVEMGKRLASSGYSVLVVNPYYRSQKGPVISTGSAEASAEPGIWDKLRPLSRSLSETTVVTDSQAFVAFLDSQAPVDVTRKIGTMGYCMSGPFTLRAAAALPERIGAAASFHGGGLATDRPDSPHLLIPGMKAQFLIAIAENDHKRAPEVEGVLRSAFEAAGLQAEVEVYQGTQHGWCPPDSRVYDQAHADRAWSRLLALFERALA